MMKAVFPRYLSLPGHFHRIWPFLIGLALATFAQVSYGQQAIVGSVIATPTFVNIYWDANWQADTGIPESSMDSFTAALVDSTYFAGLKEYGVSGALFSKSVYASPACGNGGTSPNSINLFVIMGFINCESQQPNIPAGPNVIYNIFLAPSTLQTDVLAVLPLPIPGEYLDGFWVAPPFPLLDLLPIVVPITSCNFYGSYHFHGNLLGTGPIFTAIFSNPSCLGAPNHSINNFGPLTTNLSHEMVEATTDPEPGLQVLAKGGGGEVGDLCESKPPTSFLTPFRGGGFVTEYFSNNSGQCVSGFSDNTVPVPAATGPTFSMVPNCLNCPLGLSAMIPGTGFGFPSLLGPSLAPYFGLTDLNTSAKSGNSIDPDPTGVSYGPWSNTSLSISGPALVPGDPVSVNICNPASGNCTPSFFTLPPIITSTTPTPASGPAAGGTLVGIVGGGFNTNGGTTFNFGSAAGVGMFCSTSSTCTVSSPMDNGANVVDITATVGGIVSPTSYADKFTYTAPVISFLSPNLGPVGGGTSVVLSGQGLSTTKTSVNFMNSPAIGTSCLNGDSCIVQSPPSPLRPGHQPGSVQVTAIVGGMTSASTAFGSNNSFLYYIPYSPILTTSAACGDTSVGVQAEVFFQGKPVSAPQTIQFTFTPKSGRPIQIRSTTMNGIAAILAPIGQWTVQASNLTNASQTSPTIQITAISLPCPKIVLGSDYSGFAGWQGGDVPQQVAPFVLQCAGHGCPGPLQEVIWEKQLGVDPELSMVMMRVDTTNPAASASGTLVTVDSREQSSATFRSARGVEVVSGAAMTVLQAAFVGPIVEIQSNMPLARIASTSLTNLPQRAWVLTIPYNTTRGISPEASVGLFWLKRQGSSAEWTNAGVRILSVTRGTVTAEIPHAGIFTAVAFVGHSLTTR